MIAFIFPGQGTQYVGMGKDLYDAFPESRKIFDKADNILRAPLTKLCFQGPLEELTQTVNCQPAIFTTSIAYLKAFKANHKSQTTNHMAGLSLGEYTALVAAGALSFEDGLHLVASRARFMEEAAGERPGRMSCILGLDLDIVEKIVQDSGAEIANLNCPGQVVISGSPEALEKANKLAQEKQAKRVVNLEVSGAFHSSFMQPAGKRLAGVLNNINIKQPTAAVISNVTALPESAASEIKENLIKQLTQRVLWEDSVRFMLKQGVNRFFEIGPGKVLKGLIRKIDPDVEVVNIGTKEDIDKYQG